MRWEDRGPREGLRGRGGKTGGQARLGGPAARCSGFQQPSPPLLRPCVQPSSPFSPLGSIPGREGAGQSSGRGHSHGAGTSPKASGRPLPQHTRTAPQNKMSFPSLPVPGCHTPHLYVVCRSQAPPVPPGDSRVLLRGWGGGALATGTTTQLLVVSSPTSVSIAWSPPSGPLPGRPPLGSAGQGPHSPGAGLSLPLPSPRVLPPQPPGSSGVGTPNPTWLHSPPPRFPFRAQQ